MIIRPALLVHEFARLDQPGLPPRLRGMWRRVVAGLRLRTDVDVDALPFGADGSAGGLTVLGYTKRPTDGPDLYQAVLSGTGDTACLTVLLAPNDPARDWASLDAELDATLNARLDNSLDNSLDHSLDSGLEAKLAIGPDARPDADLEAGLDSDPDAGFDADLDAHELGGARVHLGLLDGPLDGQSVAAIAAAVGKGFPDAGDSGWTGRWSRTAHGFLIWEVPSTRPAPRRLVLIGSRDAEPELDAFAWTPGGAELGPFVHYLLDAAKVRYQHEVHRRAAGQIRQLRLDLDDAVDRLLALHRSASATPAQLVRADASLAELQASSTGAITVLARLRKIAHSVDAAEANLRAAVPADSPAGPGPLTGGRGSSMGGRGPLAADLALVRALRDRVADDIAYLEISRDRAERVSALTGVAVDRSLGANQQQLLLVQASVVSSILMILAAVQAFGTNLRIPGSLQIPIIAFLGSLALALPTAVLRWSRRVPRDLPLRTVDYVAACVTGVTAGWLGGQIMSRQLTGHLLEPGWTWAVTVGGGLLLGAATWLRSQRIGRPPPDRRG